MSFYIKPDDANNMVPLLLSWLLMKMVRQIHLKEKRQFANALTICLYNKFISHPRILFLTQIFLLSQRASKNTIITRLILLMLQNGLKTIYPLLKFLVAFRMLVLVSAVTRLLEKRFIQFFCTMPLKPG